MKVMRFVRRVGNLFFHQQQQQQQQQPKINFLEMKTY